MSYTKTNWVNGGAPAISAANLNKIEQALYDDDANITSILAALAQAPVIQSGFVQFDSIANNDYQEKEVAFGSAFSSAPKVIAALVSTSSAGAFGSVSCAVNSITKTGFKVRVYNNSGASRTPSIDWIAVLT